ncbi:MAG: efflux RND transporter permease subunit [Peptostreptococcaceae bacterium]|nr:efflux RND transporter permease subunit [Peptostreptococcaceae bacterium]
MIKEIAKQSIQNRKITFFLMILIAVLGVYSYIESPKQQAPDLSAPNVLITAVYPGASPEDVETLVTREIESALTSVNGYDYTYSISKDNVSVVVLYLYQDADTAKSYSEVRQKMQSLQGKLPDGVQRIEVNTDLTETAGLILSVSGEDYDQEELEEMAEEIKSYFNRTPGVSRFDIIGKRKRQISVEVDLNLLQYYNLSLSDISGILSAQNLEIPAGSIEEEGEKIDVKLRGYFNSLEDIENTIIAVSRDNGSSARLKDIAKISLEDADDNVRMLRNGEEAILLVGYFKADENAVAVGEQVKERIRTVRENLPDNLRLEQVSFQPEDVKGLVRDFTLSLLQGILLVLFVVFVGMGLKNALVVSMAIPFSILLTLCMMRLFGIKIHQISITALIISLGMLVDNAIVVSDSIQNKIDEEKEILFACLEGVAEVAYPVLSSTLTTVAAFVPLLMLTTTAGKYIRSIPQIIIISLSASYIAAIAVTPMTAYLLFGKSREPDSSHRISSRFSEWTRYFMRRKKLLFLLVLLVTGATASLAFSINMQFFPKENGDILYIDIKGEAFDIGKTEKLVGEVADILEKQEEILEYTAAVGRGLPKYYIALAPPTDAPDVAQIMMRIDLKSKGRFRDNQSYAAHLQRLIDEGITGGTAAVKELEQGYPTLGAAVTVRLSGRDPERLEEAAKQLKELIQSIPGAKNIDDDLLPQKYEFVVDIDPSRAGSLGLSKYDIQNEISAALRGKESSVYRKEGTEKDIIVKGNAKTKEDIENLFVKSPYTGESVPVREVASVELSRRWTEIIKYDRERTVSVFADADAGTDPVQIQNQIEQRIAELDLNGIRLFYDGERERIYENFGSMGILGAVAVLLVYGILLFQFNSFVQPFLILLTIPLSITGSILGLFFLRQPLSFMAMLGIVSLFGVVVNNAIVLIDTINQFRKREEDIEESCLLAVRARFRPIMLTTVTTVIGLIPLVFSKSQLFRPMAISLMFGLMISTLLTLIILPVAYNGTEKLFVKSSKR